MAEGFRVNITPRALADLEAVFDYISADSPENAARMIERILDAVHGLELMPSRFRRIGRSRKRGNPVHVCIVRPYLIYYRVDEPAHVVFVTEVRHGARKQPRHFE